MRDRIPLAAADTLESPVPALVQVERETKGARWRLAIPHNFAVIRSAAFWGRWVIPSRRRTMRELREPLMKGMDFLKENGEASGCASLRFQQTCDGAAGVPVLKPTRWAISSAI